MTGYIGSFVPFAPDEASRAKGDRRPSLARLYPSRADYDAKVEAALDELVAAGFLRPTDRPDAERAAAARWAWAVGRSQRPRAARPASAEVLSNASPNGLPKR